MRNLIRLRGFLAAVCLCMLATFSLSGCNIQYVEEEEETTSTEVIQETKPEEKITLRVWYSDDNLESYLQMCIADYESANDNVSIVLTRIPEADYVNMLTEAALKKNTVDLYIIDNDKLEQVKLSGIANRNTMTDIYNIYNYSIKALDACTYNDELIAYPLYFDTSFIIYNADYVENAQFATFEDIKSFADGYEVPAGSSISTIFSCDLDDIFYNYGYLGAYLNIGGQHGDEKTEIFDITTELTQAISLYRQLIDFFYINIDDVNYYSCINGFEKGAIMLTVSDMMAYSRIKDVEGLNTGVVAFPDMSDDIATAPLSVTTAVAVNPFSENITVAESFAKYITYTNTGNLYEQSGMLSCRRQEYEDDNLTHIYDSYEKSAPKLKLMYSDEFYALLEVSMHLMASGADDVQSLSAVRSYLEGHWSAD